MNAQESSKRQSKHKEVNIMRKPNNTPLQRSLGAPQSSTNPHLPQPTSRLPTRTRPRPAATTIQPNCLSSASSAAYFPPSRRTSPLVRRATFAQQTRPRLASEMGPYSGRGRQCVVRVPEDGHWAVGSRAAGLGSESQECVGRGPPWRLGEDGKAGRADDGGKKWRMACGFVVRVEILQMVTGWGGWGGGLEESEDEYGRTGGV